MDELTRAYYESQFEVRFLRTKGIEFQNFFSEIMELRYTGDFIRVRPWGKTGDRKCDGYLPSKRILFQVYAPNEMSAKEAISEIDEDFNGAIPYWENYFDSWVFVHNSRDGLNPDITTKLLTLAETSKPVTVLHWGFAEIKNEVFSLCDANLIRLLGYAPNNRGMNQLRYENIRAVLLNVSKREPSHTLEIRPVPGNKIKYNMLSTNVEIMLNSGMRKANLVREFFQSHIDPRYGDIVAADFKEKYQEIRRSTIEPDEIFHELQAFAAGDERSNPGIECATLAVLAYLFEECEIFERPPELVN